MSFAPVARKRAMLVGLGALAALLTTSSLAGAHGGDTNKIHGCVASSTGNLRVIDPGESCKKGETALDWSRDSGANQLKADLQEPDDDADVTGTTTVEGQGVNDGDGLVSWWNLENVPVGFADNTDNIDGGTAANLECQRCVNAADIGNEAVGTAEIANGTITAADLAGTYNTDGSQTESVIGAVTSEKIADGTISARDLASGAVPLAKLAVDVITRFESVEARATSVESRLTNLGSAPAAGDADRVSTTRLSGLVTANTSLDPASIPPLTRSEHIIPAFGVQNGDMVTVSPPPSLNDDLLFVGYDVQSRTIGNELVDVVVVYLYNASNSAIDDIQTFWKIQYLDLTP